MSRRTLLRVADVGEPRKGKHKGPQPSFVPGIMNVTVNRGDIATLPCTVHNLGTRQVCDSLSVFLSVSVCQCQCQCLAS